MTAATESVSAQARRHYYISGPMTGIKDYNRPAFMEAEEFLRRADGSAAITNPATLFDGDGIEREWRDYMIGDLAALLKCNAIVLLRGWKESRGARLEQRIADDLGYDQFLYLNGYVFVRPTDEGER